MNIYVYTYYNFIYICINFIYIISCVNIYLYINIILVKLALIKSTCVIGKIYVKSHSLFFLILSHLQSEYQQGHLNEGHAKSSSRKKMEQSTQLKFSLKVVLCCLYSPGIWTLRMSFWRHLRHTKFYKHIMEISRTPNVYLGQVNLTPSPIFWQIQNPQ